MYILHQETGTLKTYLRPTGVDQKFWASDGNEILFVVNPKAPAMTVRATGNGQFYTTPAKAYWSPKINRQTTCIQPGTGTVTMELRDLYGRNISYRINGGSWVSVGAATVMLSDSSFSDGANTLEYRSAGFDANARTRIVIKNPTHPSLVETHGFSMWADSVAFSDVVARLSREPYRKNWNELLTRTDFSSESGVADWNTNRQQGIRAINGFPLSHAFVALVRGWDYTQSGQSRSHGRIAKEMMLETIRSTNPVGFEIQMSAESAPSRELHAFGYYDIKPPVKLALAYDLFAANFRSDKVSGGMSPIEDYYIRDVLAGVAYEAMEWCAGHQALGSPEMWGGARMLGATIIARILSEYSTPYYGTSWFGSVQDTFLECPFPDVG